MLNMVGSDDSEAPGMIFIMGVTGAGKSFFINQLKPGSTQVHAGVESCTSRCQIVKTKVGETEIYIVDTPGFNDTYRTDDEILGEIADFLTLQRRAGIPLRGIIYLHKITDNRVQGSDLRYLEIFRVMVGENAFDNVIIATTLWEMLPSQATGFDREVELRDHIWKDMESKGVSFVQYDGTRDMAASMIADLAGKEEVVLQIQRELVDNGLDLDKTEAGSKMVSAVETNIARYDRQLSNLDQRLATVTNEENARRLREDRTTAQKNKQKLQAQRKRLQRTVVRDIDAKVKDEKKTSTKWKGGISMFASILGLTINIVANLLPLFGVVI